MKRRSKRTREGAKVICDRLRLAAAAAAVVVAFGDRCPSLSPVVGFRLGMGWRERGKRGQLSKKERGISVPKTGSLSSSSSFSVEVILTQGDGLPARLPQGGRKGGRKEELIRGKQSPSPSVLGIAVGSPQWTVSDGA